MTGTTTFLYRGIIERLQKIVYFAVLLKLVFSMLTAKCAATSIPKPIWYPSCETTNIVKVGKMCTTSNPSQIYYEVWQCANGHQFKNWPDDYVSVSVDDLIYIDE